MQYIALNYRKILLIMMLVASIVVLASCSTTGQLSYVNKDGVVQTACETEYFGAPSVDKFAVEYVLSYCARKAHNKGYRVIDEKLLTLDLTVPNPPQGQNWTFELATQHYDKDKLSDKEYGYLVAYIDLGLANQSAPNQVSLDSAK